MTLTTHRNVWLWGLFILGAALRLALCSVNPPGNAFDNHFEPIFLMLKLGDIPLKNACWECNQPPVFYIISAFFGKVFLGFDAGNDLIVKLLQFIPCIFDILTLPVLYFIIRKFSFSNLTTIVTFGLVCLLPRHIYMAAIHSNDALAYLLIAICLYLLFDVEKLLSRNRLILLSITIILAIFTKYTALIIFPVTILYFISAYAKRIITGHVLPLLITLMIPILLLGWYVSNNIEQYGKALPDGIELRHANIQQPPGEGNVSYLSFKPWTFAESPVIREENIGSFWTLVYGEMWFDVEPKFLYYTDPLGQEWNNYFNSLADRKNSFPKDLQLSSLTKFLGSGLIFLGLLPLCLMIAGFIFTVRRTIISNIDVQQFNNIKFYTLCFLFVCNATGIILFAMKYPFFSHFKASFLLNSLPAYAILFGCGFSLIEKNILMKKLGISALILLGCFVIAHIIQVVSALSGI